MYDPDVIGIEVIEQLRTVRGKDDLGVALGVQNEIAEHSECAGVDCQFRFFDGDERWRRTLDERCEQRSGPQGPITLLIGACPALGFAFGSVEELDHLLLASRSDAGIHD